jgi:acyl dehydratase
MPPPTDNDGGDRLYLDDLQVGQRFKSRSHALDEAQIKAFAAQFDPQPFHLDDAAARNSLFAGLAASGWHTAAITMRLLVEGGAPVAGGVIGGAAEISWPQPTRPGDVLQVESEILEVRPSRSRPDRGMVTMRSETRNQRAEVLQILTAKLVVPRRPAVASAYCSVFRATTRIGRMTSRASFDKLSPYVRMEKVR